MDTMKTAQQLADEEMNEASGGAKQARWITHKVVRGDSLFVVSQRYGVSIEKIAEWNAIADPDHLVPGHNLRIYTSI